MIFGRKVVLRDIYDSDIEAMTVWRNDPDVNKYFFTHEPISVEKQKQWISSLREKTDEKLFIIAPLEDPKRPIGTVGLVHIDRKNGRAEWGRFLIGDPSARGKGYGSEALYLSLRHAFDTLDLQRLYLEVYSWNADARSLYEKFGFRIEGTYRAHIYWGGKYHDVVTYGLLRPEFREKELSIRTRIYDDEGR